MKPAQYTEQPGIRRAVAPTPEQEQTVIFYGLSGHVSRAVNPETESSRIIRR